MKPRVVVKELENGEVYIAVPVFSWQELERVRREVRDYLKILGDRFEISPLVSFMAIWWFWLFAESRPGLIQSIELAARTVLEKLKKQGPGEIRIRKFLVKAENEEEGWELRERIWWYLTVEAPGKRGSVSEVDNQGFMKVTCRTRKVEQLAELIGGIEEVIRKF